MGKKDPKSASARHNVLRPSSPGRDRRFPINESCVNKCKSWLGSMQGKTSHL
jgi:hypothetical protein